MSFTFFVKTTILQNTCEWLSILQINWLSSILLSPCKVVQSINLHYRFKFNRVPSANFTWSILKYVVSNTVRKVYQNTRFLCPVLSRIRTKSTNLLFYGKTWVWEDPYSGIFCAIILFVRVWWRWYCSLC